MYVCIIGVLKHFEYVFMECLLKEWEKCWTWLKTINPKWGDRSMPYLNAHKRWHTSMEDKAVISSSFVFHRKKSIRLVVCYD